MTKKIAIFANNLLAGGIQKSLVNLLTTISSDYQIDCYLMNDQRFFEFELPSNVKIINLKKTNFIYKIMPFGLMEILVKNKIDKKYNLAIDFDGYQSFTAAMALKIDAKKKIIWIHNDYKQKMKHKLKFRFLFWLNKNKFKYFDSLIFVSEPLIDSLQSLLNYRLPSDKLIIPNLIDTKEIIEKSKQKVTDLEIDNNKVNFVSVGRLENIKGFDRLIDYASQMTKQRKDFHLYIIGSGPEEQNLLEKVNNLQLEPFVTFLGYQNNPFKYLKLMDCFVLTSKYEGQGMVVLEAMTLGLGIIVEKELEKYNPMICDNNRQDVLTEMVKFQKTIKKNNQLKDYNKVIIKSLERLFNV